MKMTLHLGILGRLRLLVYFMKQIMVGFSYLCINVTSAGLFASDRYLYLLSLFFSHIFALIVCYDHVFNVDKMDRKIVLKGYPEFENDILLVANIRPRSTVL